MPQNTCCQCWCCCPKIIDPNADGTETGNFAPTPIHEQVIGTTFPSPCLEIPNLATYVTTDQTSDSFTVSMGEADATNCLAESEEQDITKENYLIVTAWGRKGSVASNQQATISIFTDGDGTAETSKVLRLPDHIENFYVPIEGTLDSVQVDLSGQIASPGTLSVTTIAGLPEAESSHELIDGGGPIGGGPNFGHSVNGLFERVNIPYGTEGPFFNGVPATITFEAKSNATDPSIQILADNSILGTHNLGATYQEISEELFIYPSDNFATLPGPPSAISTMTSKALAFRIDASADSTGTVEYRNFALSFPGIPSQTRLYYLQGRMLCESMHCFDVALVADGTLVETPCCPNGFNARENYNVTIGNDRRLPNMEGLTGIMTWDGTSWATDESISTPYGNLDLSLECRGQHPTGNWLTASIGGNTYTGHRLAIGMCANTGLSPYRVCIKRETADDPQLNLTRDGCNNVPDTLSATATIRRGVWSNPNDLVGGCMDGTANFTLNFDSTAQVWQAEAVTIGDETGNVILYRSGSGNFGGSTEYSSHFNNWRLAWSNYRETPPYDDPEVLELESTCDPFSLLFQTFAQWEYCGSPSFGGDVGTYKDLAIVQIRIEPAASMMAQGTKLLNTSVPPPNKKRRPLKRKRRNCNCRKRRKG